MSNDHLDFSIVIVNYNTRNLLEDCLRSIYRSRGNITFEVIVVDNNSSDGSIDMVRNMLKPIRLITNNENLGFAKACNHGIRMAVGENILLLNSDTEVFPDTFRELKRFMANGRSDSRVGVIGCKILNPDGTLQYSTGNFPTIWSTVKDVFKPRHKRKCCLTRYDEPHEVDWITGAFMLVDRRVIQDVGLMDEWYFMYYEDVDWCLKVKKKGWKVFYYPAVRIVHKNPYALQQDETSEKVMAEIRRSHLYYYRKNHSYLSFLTLFLATCALLLINFFYLYTAFFLEKERRQDGQRKVRLLLSVVWNTFRSLNKQGAVA